MADGGSSKGKPPGMRGREGRLGAPGKPAASCGSRGQGQAQPNAGGRCPEGTGAPWMNQGSPATSGSTSSMKICFSKSFYKHTCVCMCVCANSPQSREHFSLIIHEHQLQGPLDLGAHPVALEPVPAHLPGLPYLPGLSLVSTVGSGTPSCPTLTIRWCSSPGFHPCSFTLGENLCFPPQMDSGNSKIGLAM